MKKILLPLALAAVLLLAACSAGGDTPDSSSAPDSQSASRPAGEAGASNEALHIGPLRKDSGFGEFTASQRGVYEIARADYFAGNIYYSDFETQTTKILCDAEGCAHDHEDCTAWVPSAYGTIHFAGGKLNYVCHTDAEPFETQGYYILQMNPDGTGRRTLCESSSHSPTGTFFTDDQYLLFCSFSEKYGEELVPGQPEFTGNGGDLCAVDLETGQEHKLYSLQDRQQIGLWENKLLFFENAPEPEPQSDEPPDRNIAVYERILAYNFDTGEEEVVMDEPITWNTINRFMQYENGAFYGLDGEQYVDFRLVRTDIPSGEITTLLAPIPGDMYNARTVTGYKDGWLIGSVGEDMRNVFVNAQTGEVRYAQHQYNFAQSPIYPEVMDIVAEYGDRYCIIYDIRHYQIQWLGMGAEPSAHDAFQRRYAMIDKEDYWNGVQSQEYMTEI